jgi:hypothetical protein
MKESGCIEDTETLVVVPKVNGSCSSPWTVEKFIGINQLTPPQSVVPHLHS